MADRSSFEALLRGAADMASLGFGDEMSAGIRSGFGMRGNYGDELAAVRARNAEAQQQHPWAYGAGEVMGAMPMMAVPGMGIARGASIAARIGRGALAGATLGGIQGAGSADGSLGERLSGAGTGAAIGAGIGAAAPIVGGIAGRAAGRASESGVPTPRMISDEVAYAYAKGDKLARAGDTRGAIAAMRQARGWATRQIKADAIYAAAQRAGMHPEGTSRGMQVEFAKLMKSKAINWTPDERRALSVAMHGGGGPNTPARVSRAAKAAMYGGTQPFDREAAAEASGFSQFAALAGARPATPTLAQFSERFSGDDQVPNRLATIPLAR